MLQDLLGGNNRMIFLVMLIGFFGACYGASTPGAGVPATTEAGVHAMCPGGSACPVRYILRTQGPYALKHIYNCHGALGVTELRNLYLFGREKSIKLIQDKGILTIVQLVGRIK